MYEITCPTLDQVLCLDRDHVLSAHRVSTGSVVYLRCPCGTSAMWSSGGSTFHPRPAHHPLDAA